MAGGSSPWDHKAERDLLLIVILEAQMTATKWDSISAKMQAKNYTFSAAACRQHVQKLRKGLGGPASAPGGSSRASATKPAAAAARGRKRKAAVEDNGDDEEQWGGGDDEEYHSPIKKKKTSDFKKEEDEGFASQSASSFKSENLDVNDDVKPRQIIDLENDDLYEA